MKITELRKELGINQSDLAKNIGMSERNWARIEICEIDIKLKDAWQLWAYLVYKGMDSRISLIDLFK